MKELISAADRSRYLFLKENWPLVLFALSILSFVIFRATQSVFLNYDGMALAEAAWRYSQGLGLTSSLFVEHSQDISEPAVKKVLTWWAPMAPITVGTLVKWGMSLSEAHTAYYTFWLFVLWSGWFFITARYLADWLCSHNFVALVLAFSPWFFTPQRDIDEIAFTALIPWTAISVTLLSQGKMLSGCLLTGLLTFGCIIFCNQAVGLAFVTMMIVLAVGKGALLKLTAAISVGVAIFAGLFVKKLLSASTPEYITPTFESISGLLSLAFSYANNIGVAPLLAVTDFILPMFVTSHLTEIHNKGFLPGLITLLFFLCLLCFITLKIKKNSRLQDTRAVLVLYLTALVCLWPFFILTSDLFLPGEQRLGNEKPYYLQAVPLVLFLMPLALLCFFNNSHLRFLNKSAAVFLIYIIVFTISGLNANISRARENIFGYNFKKTQWMKHNDWLIQLQDKDYDLSALIGQPPGIVFSSGTTKMALVNKNSPHEIRPVPLRSYWRKAYTSKPVTLYFILEESKPPKPLGILKATVKDRSEYSPPLRELLALPGWRMIEGEIKFCRTHDLKGITCKEMRIYRADLPAGWRGESLFAQE
jgi:hypothetical protein